MEKTRTKKTILLSVGIATMVLLISFASVVGFQSVVSSQSTGASPLFHLRLEKIINQGNNPSLSSFYIGKNNPFEIPLPTREMLTKEILNQLSRKEVKEKISLLNNDVSQKWDALLALAKNNLDEINRIIRQDYTEFQALINSYSALSEQDAATQFLEKIRTLNFQDLTTLSNTQSSKTSTKNITSGLLCNITSGQFCQITSQSICQITTQPICSLTKGFFCWTIYGPICPTTGIKCHPPTTRPTLCSIFAVAGKILKTIIIVLLLAAVIFVPLAIVSLVLVTIFNPERCDQIHQRITTWFNCTAPE
jgi:hypothetical protein